MDSSKNGAAVGSGSAAQSPKGDAVRRLAFVVHAVGRPPGTGSEYERSLAMSQAAVIEALGAVVAESLRLSGARSDQFVTTIGRDMTLSFQPLADGVQDVLVRAKVGGRVVVMRSRGGVLQHPPCDLATIEHILDATDGRYALLSSEPSFTGDECVAAIACYELNEPPISVAAATGKPPRN